MKVGGLTLIELLVTLTVIAVLLRLAAPAFADRVAAERSTAALNQLVGSIQFARSAAITQRAVVTLCPSAGDACLGRDQWHEGALVFIDRNRDGRLDADDQVLSRLPPMNLEGRVYWRSFRNRTYLQFEPRGHTAWQNGHFLYCPRDGNPRHARMIILNPQGRVRIARDRDGDGVVEDAAGRGLVCPTVSQNGS